MYPHRYNSGRLAVDSHEHHCFSFIFQFLRLDIQRSMITPFPPSFSVAQQDIAAFQFGPDSLTGTSIELNRVFGNNAPLPGSPHYRFPKRML
jgi:hypothetical protein